MDEKPQNYLSSIGSGITLICWFSLESDMKTKRTKIRRLSPNIIIQGPPSKDPASEEKNSVTRLPTVVYILLKVCTVKISFGPTHLIISLGSQCSFLRSNAFPSILVFIIVTQRINL